MPVINMPGVNMTIGAGFDGGDGGRDDDKVEARLSEVEKAVVRIDATLEFMREHMATKADVHEAVNGQVKWIVGTALVLAVGAVTVMTFVLNNAVPKAPVATQPTIIVVPAQGHAQASGQLQVVPPPSPDASR